VNCIDLSKEEIENGNEHEESQKWLEKGSTPKKGLNCAEERFVNICIHLLGSGLRSATAKFYNTQQCLSLTSHSRSSTLI